MKKPMVPLLILAALLISAGPGNAAETQAARDLFQQGNAHYQSGDYPAAERCYRQTA